MYNSRYSKFLTIALIVVIVLILGLLIFWGVETFTKYNVNNSAQEGIEAFKNQTQNGGNSNFVLPTGSNNTVAIGDPYANFVVPDNNQGGSSSNTPAEEDKEPMYEGFPMLGYIDIPKTKIKYPVLKDATMKAMEKSVCVLTGVGLNKPGVTVIAGHNYRNGLFFSDNAKLSEGDKIHIADNNGQTITYAIYKKYQTTPEDASFSTVDTNGKREIVLTTCTDDSKNRIIICAKEV